MKNLLLLVLVGTSFPLQSQEIIRVHRDPQTGEIWEKAPHRGQKPVYSRFSLSYQLKLSDNTSYKLKTFEGSYAYKWNKLWCEAFTSLTWGTLRSMSEGTHPSNKQVALSGFGLGLSNQSEILQKILKLPNSFESVTAGLGYYVLQQQDYGIGLKTDFKAFVLSSSNLHYGLKLSYHLVHLLNASHTQFFSWLNVGVDVAYYF